MGRYFGKACIRHPELEGARYDSTSTCVRCHQILQRAKRKLVPKKSPGVYFGKVCEKHPELNGERHNSSHKCKGCRNDAVNARRHKKTDVVVAYSIRQREHQRTVESKGGKCYLAKLVRNKRWYANNTHWFRARNIVKKAGLLIPLFFAHADAMRVFYTNRPDGHHIDHIVPLKGLDPVTKQHIVSGLHVPWNLQYLPGEDNARKWAWFSNT